MLIRLKIVQLNFFTRYPLNDKDEMCSWPSRSPSPYPSPSHSLPVKASFQSLFISLPDVSLCLATLETRLLLRIYLWYFRSFHADLAYSRTVICGTHKSGRKVCIKYRFWPSIKLTQTSVCPGGSENVHFSCFGVSVCHSTIAPSGGKKM